VKFWCMKANIDRKNAWYYHTTVWKSSLDSQESIFHISVSFSPCVRVFFPEKTQEKCVICDILMCEGKSWQAKHVILPHHYMKIKPWLTGINGKYLCLCFTICKGLFSWENPQKIDNLRNFDVWSQILTGKMCATAKPLYENQASTHRHQFPISIFFCFTMCKGFVSCENIWKIGNLSNFDEWSHVLMVILPHHYYMKNEEWLTGIKFTYLCLYFTMCARVFFPKKTNKKWVQCEILMREARSQQAKHAILTHHSMQIKHLLTEINWLYLCFCFIMFTGLVSWENTGKIGNL
jgi:hypothetical protein